MNGRLFTARISLLPVVETLFLPSRINPFEFTEKFVYLVPISQKSKPILEDAEKFPASVVGTNILEVPEDMSVKDPVVVLVKV